MLFVRFRLHISSDVVWNNAQSIIIISHIKSIILLIHFSRCKVRRICCSGRQHLLQARRKMAIKKADKFRIELCIKCIFVASPHTHIHMKTKEWNGGQKGNICNGKRGIMKIYCNGRHCACFYVWRPACVWGKSLSLEIRLVYGAFLFRAFSPSFEKQPVKAMLSQFLVPIEWRKMSIWESQRTRQPRLTHFVR